MKIYVGQINPTVGAIKDNEAAIASVLEQARKEGAQLIVFPQLVLSGAPLHDLLFHEKFVEMCEHSLSRLAPLTYGLDVILGSPALNNGYLYDSAVLFSDGREYGRQFESRLCWEVQGKRVAVLVGEEAPSQEIGEVDLTVHIAASPWSPGQAERRLSSLRKRAQESSSAYLFVNLVGGNDEWIFDGNSFYVDKEGAPVWSAPSFEEGGFLVCSNESRTLSPIEEVRQAAVLGIRDYFDKQRVETAHIALSGGIDSSLTAALVTEALGPKRVRGLFLPSRFTSKTSRSNVDDLVKNLDISLEEISVEPMLKAALDTLGPVEGLSFENLQSRIRTVILMARSNEANSMVVGTGNKSEETLGYATLYGDLSGALLPLGDLFKTECYELARHLNSTQPLIPQAVLDRAPTAELHLDQHDTDDLPEYETLDPLLQSLVLEGAPLDDQALERMMWKAEYKRRQSPPILRLSHRSFGSEARYPITNGLRFVVE